MDIPANTISALTSAVLVRSGEFARRLQLLVPSILCDVGHYSNDAFLLRSFVSLRTDADGDELAMSVDITARHKNDAGTTISIESDLCLDNGTIVAAGPSAEFDTSRPGLKVESSSWIRQFNAFLDGSEAEAIKVLRSMTTSGHPMRRKKAN